MQEERHRNGPEPGLTPEELDQALRTGRTLLDPDLDTPRSVFVATQYRNGTEFLHAHCESDDRDAAVYDLLTPLAVHVREVAAAANASPDAVVEGALELLESTGERAVESGE